jgi:hypothetical protein
MSRFKGLHLEQGKQKFNLGYVELEISKSIGKPNWEVTIRAEDIWGIYKAYDKSPTFRLHAEWTSKSHGVIVHETIFGEFWIDRIDPNKTSTPTSPRKLYTLHGYSPNLDVSGVPDNERVKVQFD